MEHPESEPGVGRFVAELRRRHVGRVTIAYTAVCFVVLQIAEIVFPAFLPGFEAEAGLRVLVVACVALFPVVATMAWVYEITPQGIRTMDALDAASGRSPARGFLPRVSLALLMLVAGGVAYAGWYRMDTEAVAEAQQRRATARAAIADALSAGSSTPAATDAPRPDGPSERSSGDAVRAPGPEGMTIEGSVTTSADEVRVTVRLLAPAPAPVPDLPDVAATGMPVGPSVSGPELLTSVIDAVTELLGAGASTDVRPAT